MLENFDVDGEFFGRGGLGLLAYAALVRGNHDQDRKRRTRKNTTSNGSETDHQAQQSSKKTTPRCVETQQGIQTPQEKAKGIDGGKIKSKKKAQDRCENSDADGDLLRMGGLGLLAHAAMVLKDNYEQRSMERDGERRTKKKIYDAQRSKYEVPKLLEECRLEPLVTANQDIGQMKADKREDDRVQVKMKKKVKSCDIQEKIELDQKSLEENILVTPSGERKRMSVMKGTENHGEVAHRKIKKKKKQRERLKAIEIKDTNRKLLEESQKLMPKIDLGDSFETEGGQGEGSIKVNKPIAYGNDDTDQNPLEPCSLDMKLSKVEVRIEPAIQRAESHEELNAANKKLKKKRKRKGEEEPNDAENSGLHQHPLKDDKLEWQQLPLEQSIGNNDTHGKLEEGESHKSTAKRKSGDCFETEGGRREGCIMWKEMKNHVACESNGNTYQNPMEPDSLDTQLCQVGAMVDPDIQRAEGHQEVNSKNQKKKKKKKKKKREKVPNDVENSDLHQHPLEDGDLELQQLPLEQNIASDNTQGKLLEGESYKSMVKRKFGDCFQTETGRGEGSIMWKDLKKQVVCKNDNTDMNPIEPDSLDMKLPQIEVRLDPATQKAEGHQEVNATDQKKKTKKKKKREKMPNDAENCHLHQHPLKDHNLEWWQLPMEQSIENSNTHGKLLEGDGHKSLVKRKFGDGLEYEGGQGEGSIMRKYLKKYSACDNNNRDQNPVKPNSLDMKLLQVEVRVNPAIRGAESHDEVDTINKKLKKKKKKKKRKREKLVFDVENNDLCQHPLEANNLEWHLEGECHKSTVKRKLGDSFEMEDGDGEWSVLLKELMKPIACVNDNACQNALEPDSVDIKLPLVDVSHEEASATKKRKRKRKKMPNDVRNSGLYLHPLEDGKLELQQLTLEESIVNASHSKNNVESRTAKRADWIKKRHYHESEELDKVRLEKVMQELLAKAKPC